MQTPGWQRHTAADGLGAVEDPGGGAGAGTGAGTDTLGGFDARAGA